MIEIKPPGRKIVRVSAASIEKAEALFKAASLLIIPDDLTQRQTFAKLMPHLYVLRRRGCSFNQLTTLLSQIGVNLQPSTVKAYYWEMFADQQDICQKRFDEQILVLAKIRKENNDGVIDESTKKIIDSINKKNTESPANPVSVVTQSPIPSPVAVAEPASVTMPSTVSDDGKKSTRKLKPVPGDYVEQESTGFGLLTKKTGAAVVKKPAYFDVDEPGQSITTGNSVDHHNDLTNATPRFRCCPLKSGVEPLRYREQNDPSMYIDGPLEHPMIDGLMLSLAERLFGANLEYENVSTGEVVIENPTEKRFRVMWKKPLEMQKTSTSKEFTKMDLSLFQKP